MKGATKMANYCSNNIAFYSIDKNLLQNLHDIMLDVFNNSKSRSVYEVLLKHGYSKEEAEKISDSRDYLSYMEFELTDKRCGYYAFKAETESAWQPNMTSFFQLLQDKYHNQISLVYVAEEPGSCIFINTDVDRLFFEDNYRLDYCVNNDYQTEYFAGFSEVIDYINEKLPKAKVCVFDTPKQIKDKVHEAYITKETYNNFYFYLDRFTCNYESRWN